MKLSEVNAKAILLDIHRDIDKSAEYSLSIIFNGNIEDLAYPPNMEFSSEEIEALRTIKFSPPLKSALRKILSDNSAGVIFNVFNNIDGTTDPEYVPQDWAGVKLVDQEPNPKNLPMEEFLHDQFYESYWDWKKLKDEM